MAENAERHICFTQTLDHPRQTLTVEYIRDAEWDRHWAMVFNGASGCRQEVRRTCTYGEARKAIDLHMSRLADLRSQTVPA